MDGEGAEVFPSMNRAKLFGVQGIGKTHRPSIPDRMGRRILAKVSPVQIKFSE
jgi:hypothetical protein